MVPGLRSWLCGGDTEFRILEGEWRNVSFTVLPPFNECFRNVDLPLIPLLFLLAFCPVTLYDLWKSQSGPLKCLWAITTRLALSVVLVSTFFTALCLSMYRHFTSLDVLSRYLLSDLFRLCGVGLALMLLIGCRNRGIVTSGVLFIFWLLSLLCALPEARDRLTSKIHEDETLQGILFYAYFALVFIQLLLSSFADPPKVKHEERSCPELFTSFLNQLTFSWFTDLVAKGYQRSLAREDLWDLNERDLTDELNGEFLLYFKKELQAFAERRKTVNKQDPSIFPSILWPIFKCYKFRLLVGVFLKLAFDVLQFVSPQLLNALISFVEDGSQSLWVGVSIAVLMFVVALVQSMILHQYFHGMIRLGMNVRSVLTAAVYDKALRLSNSARKNRTSGEIVNLMSVDVQRFQDISTYMMLFWSAPLQVLLSIYFLWRLLGIAVLGGLAVLIAMIPFNSLISVQ